MDLDRHEEITEKKEILKECKGNERTVPSWGKSPKIGRIRAMYREKEAPP